MTSHDLLEAIGGAEDELLCECGKKIKPRHGALIAACLCLSFAGLAALYFINAPLYIISPDPQSTAEYIENPDTPLVFNVVGEENVQQKAGRIAYPAGYFYSELNENELNTLFPQSLPLEFSGRALFTETGALHELKLSAGAYSLTAADRVIRDCVYVWSEAKPDITLIDGCEITAVKVRHSENGLYSYEVSLKPGSVEYLLYCTDVEPENCEKTESELSLIAAALVQNGDGGFHSLKRAEVPEYFEYDTDFASAAADAEFGSLWLRSEPSGAQYSGIHRVKSGTRGNYLSGYWEFADGAYIEYKLRMLQENDKNALISSAAEREKYDMSLYSVPLADSVPQSLWSYVDFPLFESSVLSEDIVRSRVTKLSGGFNIRFAVRYGSIVAEINSADIPSEQLYSLIAQS